MPLAHLCSVMVLCDEPFERWSQSSLKETCRAYNLRIGGSKEFLINRIRSYLSPSSMVSMVQDAQESQDIEGGETTENTEDAHGPACILPVSENSANTEGGETTENNAENSENSENNVENPDAKKPRTVAWKIPGLQYFDQFADDETEQCRSEPATPTDAQLAEQWWPGLPGAQTEHNDDMFATEHFSWLKGEFSKGGLGEE